MRHLICFSARAEIEYPQITGSRTLSQIFTCIYNGVKEINLYEKWLLTVHRTNNLYKKNSTDRKSKFKILSDPNKWAIFGQIFFLNIHLNFALLGLSVDDCSAHLAWPLTHCGIFRAMKCSHLNATLTGNNVV